jgi:uncharacterized protein YndB with AHSA1/START domain
MTKKLIHIHAIVNKPLALVWEMYTSPEHVVNWNAASEDWHTPKAENDLQVGGVFRYTMAAKDGSFSFDFWGTYNEVVIREKLDSTLGDGRSMLVTLREVDDGTRIDIEFEMENQNPEELQRAGWQAILNNFKKYAELHSMNE